MHSRERGSRLTRFEVWTKVQAKSGRIIEDLIPPLLPESLEYLWIIYIDIRKGSAVVCYSDLVAYMQVSDLRLTPWESELMLKIDALRAKV